MDRLLSVTLRLTRVLKHRGLYLIGMMLLTVSDVTLRLFRKRSSGRTRSSASPRGCHRLRRTFTSGSAANLRRLPYQQVSVADNEGLQYCYEVLVIALFILLGIF